jgi:hypothetical protein
MGVMTGVGDLGFHPGCLGDTKLASLLIFEVINIRELLLFNKAYLIKFTGLKWTRKTVNYLERSEQEKKNHCELDAEGSLI